MTSVQELDERRGRSCVPWAVLALVVLGLCLVIAIPNLIDSRKYGGEAPAIGALKTINTSQTLFREGDKEGDGVLDYGDLQELSNTTLIDGVLGSGVKQGYRFEVRASPATPEFLWFAVANPVTPGTTGDRYFCTNHAGVIYYTGLQGRSISVDAGGAECTIPTRLLPVGK
jgi:type IV pilus assembly protein PilA